MSFLGMGTLEILVIVILFFLFFGPERLPEIVTKSGKLYRKLIKATGELTKTLNKEISLDKEISLEKEQKENSPTEQSQSISQNAESQIDRKTEDSVAESDKESNG